MKPADLDCLTERHLLLFGTIIQWFARYELLMQEIMAAVTEADSGSVILLVRGLDFSGKRQALIDLLRHRTIPLDRYDEINRYLMVAHTLTPLRNDIAHSGWIPGPSSDGIQPNWVLRIPPSITPLHGDGLIEREEDKVTYSLAELDEIVETLAVNYRRFVDYLREIGLVRK
jgi:hypothetical protein